MCDYCGCRAIPTIAELTEEHEQIAATGARLRAAIAAQNWDEATAHLSTMQTLLPVHTAVEESGLFPIIGALDEFAEGIALLYDDHDDIDTALLAGTPDWSAVVEALDVLTEHIYREEHGLFPTSLRVLSPAQWDHVEALRHSIHGRSPEGHEHPHSHAGHADHEHHTHPHVDAAVAVQES